MIPFLFFSIYVLLIAVYALFLFRVMQGLRYLHEQTRPNPDASPSGKNPSVSVLIPVRNEAAAMPGLLDSLAKQSYPPELLEAIVIDDHSEDDSAGIVQNHIDAGFPFRLRLLTLSGDGTGKKQALTEAVGIASGAIVVTTDADCTHDPDWIASMVQPFEDGADIVAGAVVIPDRRTFFSRAQALDFLGLMGVGAGLFGIGYPRLCNGANLAYRRELFEAVGGYRGNEGISSGDDEFLMHKIVYEHHGTPAFCTASSAVVHTPAASGIVSFLMQRSRWASKGARYGDSRFVAFLVLIFFFFLFVAISPAMFWYSVTAGMFTVLFWIGKAMIEFPVLLRTAALLKQPVRISDFVIAELLHPFYLVGVTIAGTLGLGRWKGRKVQTRKKRIPVSG